MVANFRTYEGQLRLLTAVIAAHPELRLNYKETAKHFGSDWTESGIEHFFRPIKKNSKAIQDLVRRGEDAKNFTHQVGKEPATPGSATPKTPRTTGGGRKRAAPASGRTPASKKMKEDSVKKVADSLNTDLDDDSDNEHPPLDLTPTKPHVRINKQKLREYQEAMASGFKSTETPALEPAQAAATPEDEDDVKIVTPADAGPAFSFAQSNTQSSSAGGDGLSSWDHNPFSSANSYFPGTVQKNSNFDDDDEYAGEC